MHPFSIQHIDHIVLRVADLQRSIDFYSQVFGAEVVKRNEPLGLIHLRAGTSMGSAASTAYKLGQETSGSASVVAGIGGMVCVSQIVGHVTDDMRRLQARLRQEGEIDCQGWLRQLESSYTTLEQQRVHSGDARAQVEQSSVTFF